jgi:hypothetical protein
MHDLFSGSWLLVRRVAQGSSWHPARLERFNSLFEDHSCRDNLAGTDVYGTYEANSTSGNTFSIVFQGLVNNSTEIMFMTGDRTQYVVTKIGGLTSQGTLIPLNATYLSGCLEESDDV